MGGQRKTKHGTHNGAGRGNQRHRQGQTQIGKVTAQKTGAGSKRARKGHHQASTAHKVEVEGEKTAHQRHKQHAAAHASHNGDDTKNKAEEQQSQRPVPPRVVVDDGSLKTLSSGLGGGGSSLHRSFSACHCHNCRGLLGGGIRLCAHGSRGSRRRLVSLRRNRASKPQTQCHGQQNELYHRILCPAVRGSLEIKSHFFPLAAFCRRKFIYGQHKLGWKGGGILSGDS